MMKYLILLMLLVSTFGAKAVGVISQCNGSKDYLDIAHVELGYKYPKASPYISTQTKNYASGCYCDLSTCPLEPVYIFVQPYSTVFTTISGGAAPTYAKLGSLSPGKYVYFAWKGTVNGQPYTLSPTQTPQMILKIDNKTQYIKISPQWSVSYDDPVGAVVNGIMEFYVCPSSTFVFSNCQQIEQQVLSSGHSIANCEVGAGAITNINLGTISSRNFSTPGVPILNYKKHVAIPLNCSGVSASSINANFYAQQDTNYSSFATSSISGAGVAVLNNSGSTVSVGGGVIPITISNNQGTLDFDVAPVATGDIPAAGSFTSLMTITLSIP